MENMNNDTKNTNNEIEFDNNYKKKKIQINARYNNDQNYDYSLRMLRINLDREKDHDISTGKGFIISPYKNIKKDIKDTDGIFSTKFGQSFGDINPFIQRWRCECGNLQGSIHKNMICPLCNKPVLFIGDDYSKFGWLILNEYVIIHPNIYSTMEYFFGPGTKGDKDKRSKLYNILNYTGNTDKNGHDIFEYSNIKDQPYYGIGMIDFVNKFDEIMDYYLKKYPKKIDIYNQIYENKNKIFTHSIPVFTSLLRPIDIRDGSMYFEATNAIYNMMNSLVTRINKKNTRIDTRKRIKNKLLFDLQIQVQELYDEILKILSGKKGELRQLIGGRFNFSSRSVIVQNSDLRIDQVKLPYITLAIILEQKICNILCRSYNIGESEAYNIWFKGLSKQSDMIKDIINSIIHSNPEGLQVIINRNPTINFGSILSMYCIGINDNFTMAISNQILRLIAGDYDGDVLNILLVINDAFGKACNNIFNPRNNMYISHNDGLFNMSAGVQRDTIINANTLMNLGRKYISNNDNRIANIKNIISI